MKTKIEKMTDSQLEAERRDLPKYQNDMTTDQRDKAFAIYAEQLKRYKAKVAEYNATATKETGLKHGDKVSRFQPGLFGTGGEEYIGKVIFDRNGRLAIRTKKCDGSGRKTFKINKGWKKI